MGDPISIPPLLSSLLSPHPHRFIKRQLQNPKSKDVRRLRYGGPRTEDHVRKGDRQNKQASKQPSKERRGEERRGEERRGETGSIMRNHLEASKQSISYGRKRNPTKKKETPRETSNTATLANQPKDFQLLNFNRSYIAPTDGVQTQA
jgi:hypothetical protein